ncbi:MAG TPA: M28 family peptidase, partial [Thermoanaerobaculaceae bacterium]|nr:M28 family peptidase [Thermoanaerobaculaceae bacterium]HRS17616.1 M28 family peptidase [Thermoanaerobaculaceae bacterium]
MRMARLVFVATLMSLFGSLAGASGPALVRIERQTATDRAFLIEQGITLVLEQEDSFLALGEAEAVSAKLAAVGREGVVVDADTEGWTYFMIGLRPGTAPGDAAICGDPVYALGEWVLVRTVGDLPTPCQSSSRWFVRRLPLRPLAAPAPPPEKYARWNEGEPAAVVPHPVVQTIVNSLTNTMIQSNWSDIVNVATTRYSRSAGCQTAAEAVFAKFQALGLNPVYQHHTTGHAPNVIGTITGTTHPERLIIVIGHLDDMPSTGNAPGANDNASGAATVTSAAQAMAGYTFANTVKFVAVTGEEQGLYGSEYFADHIPSGEQVVAVLNADMTGWQGDGLPASGENLDVNANSTSSWLGLLMEEAATAYGTGCPIDYFSCSSMVYSDHAPFWDHGWSAICGITDNEGYCGHGGSYPYYHTSNDTLANCGAPAFFYSTVKAYVATAAHLAEPMCGGGAFPPVPTGVSATPSGDNRITVSWASGGSGLQYTVQRARGGCGEPFGVVATTSATSWVDTNVSGGVTYAYRVVASRAECVTEPSACVTAVTTGSCQEYPEFAGVATAANAAQPVCTVNLGWSPATPLCSGPVTYNVYRSTVPSFTPGVENRIATGVAATVMSDAAGLQSSTPAYYIVRAVDGSNGAEDGNAVVRSATPTGPIAYSTWSDDAGDSSPAAMTVAAPWAILTTGGHAGPGVYKTVATNQACGAITTPELYIGSGSELSFWSKYFLGADNSDKGQVEISTDGGQSWQRLTMAYPTKSTTTTDKCGLPKDLKYFAGINQTWTEHTASLAAFAGQLVRLRFRISTDATTSGEVWWIDDISVTQVQTPSVCSTGTAALSPRSVAVDVASLSPGSSDANGVLEPGEAVILQPTWHNDGPVAVSATGTAAAWTGPAGATYSVLDGAADYGSLAPGADGTCGANPYGVALDVPAVRPAAHWDATFVETLSTGV